MKARKQTKITQRMLFTWLMLIGLIFLFSPQKFTSKLQFAFARIFHWPLSISRNVSLAAHTRQPMGDSVSRRDYNKLQNHLSNVIAQRDQLHQENQRLSGLRKRLPFEGADIVIADVIRASIDSSRCELLINRGKTDGLRKDQFVLGNNSIIGRISEVGPGWAQVIVFTDPRSKTAVTIEGLKVDRFMQGSGRSSASIRMVKEKIKVESEVLVEKKGGFLNTPMIMGRVRECRRNADSGLLWDIIVRPACDLENLKDVAVIIMNSQRLNGS